MAFKQYTIKQSDLVEALRVSPDTVIQWVQSGELFAVDVRRKGAKRPSYRFNQEDVEAFIQSRSNRPKTDKPKHPSRKPQKVIQYV